MLFVDLLTLAYFNPIELGRSQLKSFLLWFAPTNASMIDIIIAVALNLTNSQHLRNWESLLLLSYLITAGDAVISHPIYIGCFF